MGKKKEGRREIWIPLLTLATSTLFIDDIEGIPFDTSTASTNRVKDLVLEHRLFVPYGPDLSSASSEEPSEEEVWNGYGFGMGAVDHFAYDPYQGYLYTQSKAGPYIAITDYATIPPILTPLSLEFDLDINDVAICGSVGLLFVVATNYDRVLMYRAVQRSDPQPPELLLEIDAGLRPDKIRLNQDCSILAVTNENDGHALADGTIHLVTNFQNSEGSMPTVRKLAFDGFDDDYLLSRNVHMPLTKSALEYWDDHSEFRDDVNWSYIRSKYNPGIFMKPQFLRFSSDSNYLHVNLQQNSALVRINVPTATIEAIDGYGLKNWVTSSGGIDIIRDNNCLQKVTNPILHTIRAPHGIDVAEVDGTTFILTAEEGSNHHYNYGPYEEDIDAGDLFHGVTLRQRQFTADPSIFSTTSSSTGLSAPFNFDCPGNLDSGDPNVEWCAPRFEISQGSSAVDYRTNPAAPEVRRVVGFGGRGISIYRIPTSTSSQQPISWVWDSGSTFEQEGCDTFPWAHNGIQDENFAPVDGVRYELNPEARDRLDDMNDPFQDGCEDAGNGNPGACPISQTIDAKAATNGLAPQTITVATACDRLLTVSCGKHNGNCFLYDITELGNGQEPLLLKIFNLSPVSETTSPGVAYDDRTLGDVNVKESLFLPPQESPTGTASIMFAGVQSGTISLWEFQCEEPVDPVEERVFVGFDDKKKKKKTGTGPQSTNDEEDGLSSGGIAGISIAILVALGLCIICCFNRDDGHEKEMDTGAT